MSISGYTGDDGHVIGVMVVGAWLAGRDRSSLSGGPNSYIIGCISWLYRFLCVIVFVKILGIMLRSYKIT